MGGLQQDAGAGDVRDDIEVPAIAWKYSPGGPPGTSSRIGRLAGQDLHAGRGDVGLDEVPAGPRDEKRP